MLVSINLSKKTRPRASRPAKLGFCTNITVSVIYDSIFSNFNLNLNFEKS